MNRCCKSVTFRDGVLAILRRDINYLKKNFKKLIKQTNRDNCVYISDSSGLLTLSNDNGQEDGPIYDPKNINTATTTSNTIYNDFELFSPNNEIQLALIPEATNDENNNINIDKNKTSNVNQVNLFDKANLLFKPEKKKYHGNFSGCTLLMIAAWCGYLEAAKLFVKQTNTCAIYGQKAIFGACLNGHTEMVKFLLDNKEYDNSRRFDNVSGLMAAAKNGHTKIVELLLQNEKNRNAVLKKRTVIDGWTALIFATRYKHYDIVKLLAPYESRVRSKNGECALHFASYFGDLEMVKILLPYESGIQDKQKFSCLHFAAMMGFTEVVKEIIDYGKKKHNSTNNDLLQLNSTSSVNSIKKEKKEKKKGEIANNENNTKVFEKLPLLTQLNENVSETRKSSINELENSTSNSNLSKNFSVEEEISIESNKSQVSHFYESVNSEDMDYSSKENEYYYYSDEYSDTISKEEAKEVMKRKYIDIPEIGMLTEAGFTALMIAAEQNYPEIVEILFDYEAGIQSTTLANKTALIVALEKGAYESAKVIIEKSIICIKNSIEKRDKESFNKAEIGKLIITKENNTILTASMTTIYRILWLCFGITLKNVPSDGNISQSSSYADLCPKEMNNNNDFYLFDGSCNISHAKIKSGATINGGKSTASIKFTDESPKHLLFTQNIRQSCEVMRALSEEYLPTYSLQDQTPENYANVFTTTNIKYEMDNLKEILEKLLKYESHFQDENGYTPLMLISKNCIAAYWALVNNKFINWINEQKESAPEYNATNLTTNCVDNINTPGSSPKINWGTKQLPCVCNSIISDIQLRFIKEIFVLIIKYDIADRYDKNLMSALGVSILTYNHERLRAKLAFKKYSNKMNFKKQTCTCICGGALTENTPLFIQPPKLNDSYIDLDHCEKKDIVKYIKEVETFMPLSVYIINILSLKQGSLLCGKALQTPLMLAAKLHDPIIVRIILNSTHESLGKYDIYGNTALILSIGMYCQIYNEKSEKLEKGKKKLMSSYIEWEKEAMECINIILPYEILLLNKNTNFSPLSVATIGKNAHLCDIILSYMKLIAEKDETKKRVIEEIVSNSILIAKQMRFKTIAALEEKFKLK